LLFESVRIACGIGLRKMAVAKVSLTMAALCLLNVCARGQPLYFSATLTADPAAVQPVIPSSRSSRAQAKLFLGPSNDEMLLFIDWELDSISSTNKVIGIHIHDGNSSENGGILYGFCGQNPFPAFGIPSGPCAQKPKGLFVYTGSPCALGKGSPCVTTSGETGVSTAASAASYLRKHRSTNSFYINLHTDLSYDSTEKDNMSNTSKAWGLIRGQLVETIPLAASPNFLGPRL
jgi:hypothetical protein